MKINIVSKIDNSSKLNLNNNKNTLNNNNNSKRKYNTFDNLLNEEVKKLKKKIN